MRQTRLLCFIYAATLNSALSLTIRGGREAVVAQAKDVSLLNRTRLRQEQSKSREYGDVDPVLVRPNSENGADQVAVGLRIMNFYGTELKKHRFSIDMVMSARWKDSRVIELIPEGLEQLSMAWDQALQLVWMPGIVVTNRDIEQYEIVSASVTIFRTGEVLRVERAQAKIMNKFQLQTYPFDTQHIAVKVASSKYMLDEVKLVADNNASGVNENIWGLYDLRSWTMESYETQDGVLKKSRGALYLDLHRFITKYWEDHLVPSFIALTISWAVFYFPFAGPFITPRLALSILALLTFTNLMVKSSKELPGSAPFNWNDLFNQQIQALMFVTIILNISSEICFHQVKKPAVARTINMEAKIVMPIFSLVNISLILTAGRWEWIALTTATIFTKMTIFVLCIGYGGYVGYRVYHEEADQTK